MPTLRFGKYLIDNSNLSEVRHLKHEIFDHLIYDLHLNSSQPTLIDAGAHVGLATLFFKTQWPDCRITAVEPLPQNLNHLRSNLWQNQIEAGVTIVAAALDAKVGERPLYYDSTPDAWFSAASFTSGAWDHTQASAPILVPTITPDSLPTRPVDLVKLDIEAAEVDVLRASRLLHHVSHFIVELHPPHSISELEAIFRPTHHLKVVPHHYGLSLLHAHKK